MLHRRDFHRSLLTGGAAALAARTGLGAETTVVKAPRGKAESCIFLWLGGGMCHVDTFDPKRLGDPETKKAGSAYKAIPSAIRDVEVCEHLPKTADLLDRGIVLRTCFHDQNEEHARPTNLFKTGRPTSDTIIYPSIGSIISHERGPRAEGVPPYVVMGYPNVTRGPGFLGAKYGYIYLTDTEAGPAGLRRPDEVTDERSRRRLLLLDGLREQYRTRTAGDDRTADYDAVIGEAQRLGGPEFLNVFDLKNEPDAVRNRFGDEFGQRCLLARRLVQTGVRYVEVSFNLNFINGTGWDTHTHGQKEQHKLIQSLDVALSALLVDLEKHKLLDSTLVVLATEFGRPPEFDGGGGRGHQASTFSTVLFGGGLKTGQVVGQTDELGKKPLVDPISLPDWHATIHAAMGIDPAGELYAGDRPVPITDYGKPIARLFA
jgi:hypothetical protein